MHGLPSSNATQEGWSHQGSWSSQPPLHWGGKSPFIAHQAPLHGSDSLSVSTHNRRLPVDLSAESAQAPIARGASAFSHEDEDIQLLPTGRLLKRIPKASRGPVAGKLTAILNRVVSSNSFESWESLLCFPRRYLGLPKRGGRRWNLSKQINHRLIGDGDDVVLGTVPHRSSKKGSPDPLRFLASRVSSKLEEGDFRGAVRLACSEDTVAEANDTTMAALSSKHPAPHPDSILPSPPTSNEVEGALSVENGDVLRAIRSFPSGSAGGPDGLRPQHLVDLTSASAGQDGEALLGALTSFTNLVLAGDTAVPARKIFFGASLIALNKKDGGVRPIAVGCTLRRLIAKTASQGVLERMGSMLAPLQLGYGTPLGSEAAVHSARQFVASLSQDQVFLKLDFKNAFNSVRRDKVLQSARQHIPEVFPYVYSCYSTPSTLRFAHSYLSSAEGVQQGDPLGPLLFCLAIHPLILQLKAEFRVFYLDDGSLGVLRRMYSTIYSSLIVRQVVWGCSSTGGSLS